MLIQLWSGSSGTSHNREMGNQRGCYVVLSRTRQKVKDTAVFLLEINF